MDHFLTGDHSLDDDGLRPIHRAARDGDWAGVLRALDDGAALEQPVGPVRHDKLLSREGATALHLAAEAGHREICAGLLERGVAVDRRDAEERTALHYACRRKPAAAVVELLLAHRADPNAVDWTGESPLHWAARHRDLQPVTLLVDGGARAGLVARRSGMTPLHVAALNGHEAVTRLLIDRGADRALRDGLRRTAADWARAQGHRELGEWLDREG